MFFQSEGVFYNANSMNDTLNENTPGCILHINNFEGPLDLLWELIKKSRIDISELSISAVTEQYISYLKLMETLNYKLAIEFIWMASELLYYKSRALLPSGNIEDEFFVPPLPPELVQKLLEYKKFQSASQLLRKELEKADSSFQRVNRSEKDIDIETITDLSLFDLLKAFAEVIESTHEVEQEEIVFDEILVSDRIDYITRVLKDRDFILFDEIFEKEPLRPVVIATFLAILEMSKTRIIRIVQTGLFGTIRILRRFNIN